MIEGDGAEGLRMPPEWWPPEEKRTTRIRNELRSVLDWPIDIVLVSHGKPVLRNARAALEEALSP